MIIIDLIQLLKMLIASKYLLSLIEMKISKEMSN